MKSDIVVTVEAPGPERFGQKVAMIEKLAAPPVSATPPVGLPTVRPVPAEPIVKKPYFLVGQATGAPGSIVEVPVFGGCTGSMLGFHIGGGCGDWDTIPTGFVLSDFLAGYLLNYRPLEEFHYLGKDSAIPEAFWECYLGFFSVAGETMIPPIPIPSGTELFRITFKIASNATPGELTLSCKDQFYYTHSNSRRRDYEYANDRQGYTDIDCIGGKIIVT